MTFEMQGWQGSSGFACPGGIPFTNEFENASRNTITTAPAAELGVQLYRATKNAGYLALRRAGLRMGPALPAAAGQHVRRPHQPAWGRRTAPLQLHPGRDDRRRHAALPGHGQLRLPLPGAPDRGRSARLLHPERLGAENPFFPSIYFRNLMYLDSVTHDPPGPRLAQAYVDYAWQHLRLTNDLFVAGSPADRTAAGAGGDRPDLRAARLAAEHLLLERRARAPLGPAGRLLAMSEAANLITAEGLQHARGRTRRARGRRPPRDRRAHQDGARMGRSEGEQRVPRRQERAGAPRDEDRAAARADRRRGHRRGGCDEQRGRRARLDRRRARRRRRGGDLADRQLPRRRAA